MRFPDAAGLVAIDEVIASTSSAVDPPLRVGDDRMVSFLASVARRLLDPALARRQPELGSLGFFLRRAELQRAADRMRAAATDAVVVPRGLVVHFPPANVDTIFVYSWALSALAGNRNIVRISNRSGTAAEAILGVLQDALAEADPIVADTQRMLSYDHDDDVTGALSQACDLRVVWGGDRSVEAIRSFPLSPLARDLAFPDRSSFAAIDVSGWKAASAQARRAAAAGFVDDLFWFDQAACASPRDLIWVGDAADAENQRASFTALVVATIHERGWRVDPSMAVEKRVATYALAASGAASRVRFHGNELADVELTDLSALQREWLGAGVVCHITVASLDELIPWLRRKDQTMSHFGFATEALRTFVETAGGRGIDRIVPFGQALRFSSTWDGMDLTREFTRLTTVQA